MTFYRRNLPHWHPEAKAIFVTWRLYGSLPRVTRRTGSYMRRYEAASADSIRTGRNACATRTDLGALVRGTSERGVYAEALHYDERLDSAKLGPRWLADPSIADCAEFAILRGRSLGKFDLYAYVVMPNHVHLLIQPLAPLRHITAGIKGASARQANVRLKRTGKPFWADESFDHWVRTSGEFEHIREYIEQNPVKARLVATPAAWRWSSANIERNQY